MSKVEKGTTEKVQRCIKLYQALLNGEQLQCAMDGVWRDVHLLDSGVLVDDYNFLYSITPHNVQCCRIRGKDGSCDDMRPFADCQEMIKEYSNRFFEMNPHSSTLPPMWIVSDKTNEALKIVQAQGDMCICSSLHKAERLSLTELFYDYTFIDGSIIGVERKHN